MYKTFFDKAEQERRWNPFRDVPYDKINREAPETLALVVAQALAAEAVAVSVAAAAAAVAAIANPSTLHFWSFLKS